MYEDYDIYIWLLVLLLATLMDEGSTPSISTKNYIQLDIIRSISNELYSNRYNGGDWIWQRDKDIMKIHCNNWHTSWNGDGGLIKHPGPTVEEAYRLSFGG